MPSDSPTLDYATPERKPRRWWSRLLLLYGGFIVVHFTCYAVGLTPFASRYWQSYIAYPLMYFPPFGRTVEMVAPRFEPLDVFLNSLAHAAFLVVLFEAIAWGRRLVKSVKTQ